MRISKLKTFLYFTLLIVALTFSISSYSQNKSGVKPTRVLFILDASGSMNGNWKTESKMDMAKQILIHLVDSLKRENIPFALRVFGHQKDKKFVDCNDTKLELAFSLQNYSKINSTLSTINPKGYSPIALSLEESIKDFPLTKTEQRSIIILISDGFENCSGDACLASSKLQSAGIYLKPYIIGLGLTEEHKKNFECVGQIFDIQPESNLSQSGIASVVINTVMNPTTMQVNLLNTNEKPTETNVNMSFFDKENGALKYNIYHALSTSGVPDTLFLDPNVKYNLKLHTLPSKTLNNIELNLGKHNIKAIEAAQGSLKLNMNGVKTKGLKCIIKQNSEIINVQDINTTVNYLVGNYDVEILTTPRLYYKDVSILQSQTKNINIPATGNITINKPIGYLYILKKNSENKLENIYTVESNITKETVSLLPGNYEIIFRAKSSTTSKSSISKKISIVSGVSTSITF